MVHPHRLIPFPMLELLSSSFWIFLLSSSGLGGFICLVFLRPLFFIVAPLHASSAFSLSLFKVPLNTSITLSLFGVLLVASPSALSLLGVPLVDVVAFSLFWVASVASIAFSLLWVHLLASNALSLLRKSNEASTTIFLLGVPLFTFEVPIVRVSLFVVGVLLLLEVLAAKQCITHEGPLHLVVDTTHE